MLNFRKILPLFGIILVIALKACTYEVVPEGVSCAIVPSIELVAVTDADCGSANGLIQVEGVATEGVVFKFSLNDQENTTGIFENLAAGSYTIEIETIDGCTNSLTTDVKNANGVNISGEAFKSGCGTNSGRITVQAEGGATPYQFKIAGQAFQDANEFTNLSPGKYVVIARDAGGCEVSREMEVKSDVAFSTVKSIVSQNCATSSCHGGNVSPDFRVESNILSNASKIKSRTESKSMPPSSSGISLTNEEIQEIACWVNDGASQ
ncbi:hypothetical protein JKA74_14025 [Marivirga sp. S37H4]|uniref:Cytochrome c domain-containing protein n=1 Tax=Marivirga aurantiaca TaxID=2802615 RepID=A0A935CCM9_9BACT|nr:hypothetical protein [Marivirga aurantiaca]MBK6266158.1 hypothetical protein [Marivirga aurantiaca]